MPLIAERWVVDGFLMHASDSGSPSGCSNGDTLRHYRLAFQTVEVSARYPASVHDLCPPMTLQGGIARCDMPVKSGPTSLLPSSHLYRSGRAAWRRVDFRDHFEAHLPRCRRPRVMRCSYMRRCCMPLGPTTASTFLAASTCCRCRRPSVARWLASIGGRSAGRYMRTWPVSGRTERWGRGPGHGAGRGGRRQRLSHQP